MNLNATGATARPSAIAGYELWQSHINSRGGILRNNVQIKFINTWDPSSLQNLKFVITDRLPADASQINMLDLVREARPEVRRFSRRNQAGPTPSA